MCNFKTLVAAAALSFSAGMALAGGHGTAWKLDPSLSDVSFGSIKNDYVGESHSFGNITGGVTDDGDVTIKLGLTSVQTNIDIRNERMVEHVFANAAMATVTAQIDMSELDSLDPGEAMSIETEGTLTLLGTETVLDATFFVMRLSETQTLVTTNGMVMLSTEDAGIDAGIDTLQKLANLDSITRVSPVTMRLIFNSDG